MTLAVVTDSAACLPPALADRCGIEVVPLHAIEDGETPSTARPSVAELAAAYASALERADEVLAIHISSVLSGTVDNARLAAQELAAGGRSASPAGRWAWPPWRRARPVMRAAAPPGPGSLRRAPTPSSWSRICLACGAAGAWTARPV